MTGLFLLQVVIPSQVAGASGSVPAQELWRRTPSFPSLPAGVQGEHGIRNPQFHVHHHPDPINARNGNLFLAYQDVFIPARGFPLEVSRAYNSHGATTGVFGRGWSSSLDTTAQERPDGSLRITEWDGSATEYRLESRSAGGPASRRFATIVPSIEYVTKHADGSYTRFRGDGNRERYSRGGKLLDRQDGYGNGVAFTYDERGLRLLRVSDRAGRQLRIDSSSRGRVDAITDPAGRRVTYRYDANDNLIAVTDPSGAVTQFSYDASQRLTALIQADGSRINNVYEPASARIVAQEGPGPKRTTYQYEFPRTMDVAQRTVVTNSAGNKTTYAYREAQGRVNRLTITDAMGGTTVEEYDASGNLVTHTDANGSRRTYEHDQYGRPLAEISPRGGAWRYTYAASCTCAKPASVTNPLGHTTTIRYNDKFQQIEIANPLGHTTRFVYGPRGDLLERIAPDQTPARYQYDVYGNLTQVTSPSGVTTNYVRDTLGRVTEVVRVGGERYRYEYDARDRLIGLTNALGYRVTLTYLQMGRLTKISDSQGEYAFDYDTVGQLVRVRDREGNVLQAQYDASGNIVKVIDAASGEWSFTYDRMGRLVRTVDPLQQAMSLSYDRRGNVVAAIDRAGARTGIRYDENSQPIEVIDPEGNRTELRYDLAGRQVALSDAEGRTTRYEYDAAGRLVVGVNPLGARMEYRYDKRGRLVEQVDATGGATRLQYEADGRPVKQTDALGRAISYQYDRSGRVARVTRPDGHAIRFEYGPLGQVTKITPDNGDPIALSYDNSGQLIERVEGMSSYRYKYNRMGRLIEAEDVARRRVLRHRYDSRHNRVGTELLPDGGRTEYLRDPLSRLVELRAESGDLYRFTYDAAGRRASLSYPNRTKTSYQYDKAGRLIELSTVDPKNVLAQRERYQYDRVGSIIRKIDRRDAATSYRYDAADRLVEVRHPDGAREEFAYDAMGNILSRSDTTGVVRATYNKAHELESAGDTRFQYDANGNMVSKTGKAGNTRYAYDDFNRLRQVTLPDGKSIGYAYGAEGRVVEKRDRDELHTVYDSGLEVQTLDAQLRPVSRRTFGPAVDEVLAEGASGTKRFFHRDSIQSVTGVSDEQGSQVATVSYTGFGTPVSAAGMVPSFSLTGRPYDRDTGLIAFRFRDYDPALGRFLQRDPLGLLMGWQNPYMYASNNPTSAIDLYGLLGAKDVGKAVLGTVLVGVGAALLPWLAAGAAASAATAAGLGAAAATTASWTAGTVTLVGAGVSMAVNYTQSAGGNTDGATTLLNTGIGAVTGGAAAGIGTLASASGLPVGVALGTSAAAGTALGWANSKLTGGVAPAGAATGFGSWLLGLGASGGSVGETVAGAIVAVVGGMWEASGQGLVNAGTNNINNLLNQGGGGRGWDPEAPDPTPCPSPPPPPSPSP